MTCEKCNDLKVTLDEYGNAVECDCVNKNRDTFESLLKSTKRPGVDEFIKHLRDTNFYTAPASTKYHLNEKEGLLKHSLNVLDLALDINATLDYPCDEDSIIIVSLLHDLGKSEFNGKPHYVPNILKSGNIGKNPYKRGQEIIQLPHEILSALDIIKYIDLTDDEIFAIIHHNGMYSSLKYELIGKESPLQMILHFADMWASRVIEKE